jgi:hypothetical protein
MEAMTSLSEGVEAADVEAADVEAADSAAAASDMILSGTKMSTCNFRGLFW